ncbi:hypothetical protein KAJ27_19635 [bacterium]|nr:hypothetical protein [bacterium]
MKIYSDRNTFIELIVSDTGPSLSILRDGKKTKIGYDSSKTTSKWDQKILEFELEDKIKPPPKNGTLFIGSSSIRKWDLKKWFPEVITINRGFGGSHVTHTNRYLHRIAFPYKPDTIILYAGDNDLSVGKTPEALLLDIAWFIWKIKMSLPECHIKILSLKLSPQLAKLIPKIIKFNTYVKSLCDKSGDRVQFIDVFSKMLIGNHKPDSNYFNPDGLHLNDQGYNLWTDVISKVIKT